MAKKTSAVVKIVIPAGKATPAPPVGTALGPYGIKIMDFVNQFNEKTKAQAGNLIPAIVTIYEDRSFSFVLKKPPVSDMIRKATGLSKGSGATKREKIGSLTMDQVKKIVKDKLPDMNTKDPLQAEKTVIGTAKSMGVIIEN